MSEREEEKSKYDSRCLLLLESFVFDREEENRRTILVVLFFSNVLSTIEKKKNQKTISVDLFLCRISFSFSLTSLLIIFEFSLATQSSSSLSSFTLRHLVMMSETLMKNIFNHAWVVRFLAGPPLDTKDLGLPAEWSPRKSTFTENRSFRIEAPTEDPKTQKTTKQPSRPSTPTKEASRGKRRQSQDDAETPPKRPKRSGVTDNTSKTIIQVSNDSDIEPRKTRSQARKKILQELQEAITASEENQDENREENPRTIAKDPRMSDALQDPITPVPKHQQEPSFTFKKKQELIMKTSQSQRELRTYTFTNEKEVQSKTKLKMLFMTLETYQKVF